MCRSPSLIGHIHRYRFTIRPKVWHQTSVEEEGGSGSKVKLHSAYMAAVQHATAVLNWCTRSENMEESKNIPSYVSRDWRAGSTGELRERKRQQRTADAASPTRTRPPPLHLSHPQLILSLTNQVKHQSRCWLCTLNDGWASVRMHAAETAAVSEDIMIPVS